MFRKNKANSLLNHPLGWKLVWGRYNLTRRMGAVLFLWLFFHHALNDLKTPPTTPLAPPPHWLRVLGDLLPLCCANQDFCQISLWHTKNTLENKKHGYQKLMLWNQRQLWISLFVNLPGCLLSRRALNSACFQITQICSSQGLWSTIYFKGLWMNHITCQRVMVVLTRRKGCKISCPKQLSCWHAKVGTIVGLQTKNPSWSQHLLPQKKRVPTSSPGFSEKNGIYRVISGKPCLGIELCDCEACAIDSNAAANISPIKCNLRSLRTPSKTPPC